MLPKIETITIHARHEPEGVLVAYKLTDEQIDVVSELIVALISGASRQKNTARENPGLRSRRVRSRATDQEPNQEPGL